MSSSCVITGGGRTYRLDLEIITKSYSPSSPSSTLSESSNSTPLCISTKGARTPRKRPNQSSAEAAALLSTISPKLFSPTNLRRTNNYPVLLPSFPIPDDASLLLREQHSIEKLPVRLEPKMPESSLCSLPYLQFLDPGSPDFDAESILDEEVEEGIDSIMGTGNLSTSSNNIKSGNLDCLMGLGGLGFGFDISSNMRRALRQKGEGEWWRADVVRVKDIVPKLKVAEVKPKKKKRKKKKVEDITGRSSPEDGILNLRLWLNLDYEKVIKEWAGGSPFSGQAGSMETSADAIARLASVDLFPDVGGRTVREASMQRYKEKRMDRLFSKKIRYQVRKFNADKRPRVKGRFVRTPSLLQETVAEESH